MKKYLGLISIKSKVAIPVTIDPDLLLVLFIMVFASCSKENEKDPLLVKAFEVHKKSLSLAKDVKEVLDGMPENDSTAMRIEKSLKAWEEMVIEVPGFEHEHHHTHDHEHHHHHNHGSQINLTPQQMLDIQIELQDSIAAIKEDLLQYK